VARSRGLARRIAAVAAIAVGLLVAVLAVRTAMFASRQPRVAPARPVDLDAAAAAHRLASALRFRTISSADPSASQQADLHALHAFLADAFPRVRAALVREHVGDGSLLLTLRGAQAGPPLVLAAHLDVVAVDDERRWSQPPFDGRVVDGYVWGRGAMDDKASALALMEAIEWLVTRGFRPKRTIHLAFGHDEEIGGARGASAIARLLDARGARDALVLDEGGAITEGVIPAIDAPVATVGIAEKGFLTVVLSVASAGGHSSMPPQQSAIGILSAAIARLEARPMPADLAPTMKPTLEYLGPETPLLQRVALANLWLFSPLVERELVSQTATNAAIRTTMAATLIEGGVKANVLPTRARATLNLRIRPSDSVAGALAYIRQTVHDSRVHVRAEPGARGPSRVSPVGCRQFRSLARAIRRADPRAVVVPSLVLGATDSRHYRRLTPYVYNFAPLRVTARDLERIHGTDERVAVRDYVRMIAFYIDLIRAVAG